MKLLLLAGAGATGKTTIAQRLVKDVGAVIVESPVRKTYAEFGLSMEQDALKYSVQQQMDLQAAIFENYCTLLNETLAQHKDALVVAERSPVDYIAYQFYLFNQSLTISKIEEGRKQILDMFHSISINFPRVETYVLKFPYPASFSVDTDSSDGWRSDRTGKNYLWSCILDRELHNIKGKSSVRHLHFDVAQSTVEARIDFIKQRVLDDSLHLPKTRSLYG